MYVCVCVCVFVCVYVCIFVSQYVCVNVYLYMHVYVCVCVYVCVTTWKVGFSNTYDTEESELMHLCFHFDSVSFSSN